MIDSHTGGEPTRFVVSGGPDLGTGPWSERLRRFRGQHDSFLSAVANEPRGSDVRVGALLCAPAGPDCAAGVIFFNNVGYLGMWKQESIVGSVFEGGIMASGGQVYSSIKGTAFVNSEAELLLDPQDPFCMGIRG